MGKSRERTDRVIEMYLLTVLGSVASIVGLVLAIVFRIKDKRNHEMKESNRPAKGQVAFFVTINQGEPLTVLVMPKFIVTEHMFDVNDLLQELGVFDVYYTIFRGCVGM